MSDPITDIHLQMPWGQAITFPPHRPLAHGMRLSTHCPVQRVAEYLDEECGTPFDPGVGAIGHLYAFLWCHQTHQGNDVLEQPVPWAHGNAHIDRIIPDGEHAGVYEIKTSSARDPKPSRENIAQVMRYQYAAAHADDGSLSDLTELPWYIVVIGKAGNDSGWVRGPWEVSLLDPSPVDVPDIFAGADGIETGDQYVRWDADATDAMYRIASEFIVVERMEDLLTRNDLVGDYCACGQHRLPPPVVLDDPKLVEAVGGYRASLDRESRSGDRKKEEYAKIKELLAGEEPGRFEVAGFSVTKAKNGRLSIR